MTDYTLPYKPQIDDEVTVLYEVLDYQFKDNRLVPRDYFKATRDGVFKVIAETEWGDYVLKREDGAFCSLRADWILPAKWRYGS
jgi:hypothetical protein